MAEQRARGIVLQHHPDVVAPRQPVEERVRLPLAPRRRRADVVGDRARHVRAAAARELRAEAPVDVLEVGEELLVEQPDLVERGAPVRAPPRARAEHAARRVVLAEVASPCPRCSAMPDQRSVSPVASITSRSSKRSIFAAADAAPGSDSSPATSSPRKSGCSSTSLLTSATMSPRARSMPRLIAAANPRFSGSATSVTAGQRVRQCSAVPSLEPLSTTITSSGASDWRSSDTSATSSSARPFQVGMTTETLTACQHEDRPVGRPAPHPPQRTRRPAERPVGCRARSARSARGRRSTV